MEEKILRPSAAKLIESMRDIGYSFESALADIIDNSITALAKRISIANGLDSNDQPYIAISDDGFGMEPDELEDAMRHGSRSPVEHRGPGDLGRFGLGLKTASFAQCRCLTVLSRKSGEASACQWDLDRIRDKDEWVLRVLETAEIALLPEELPPEGSGTVVIWQKLDRLDARGTQPSDYQEALNDLFAKARSHLALTFHRFISPEPDERFSPITILINDAEVAPADPFCQHMVPKADSHERQPIATTMGTVIAQAFTLPHHSRLSASQSERISLGTSLVETQGLYVYRARRLISSGSWLGLAPRAELSKLLRVRVDVPTSLDSEWHIDVRKSRIRPPSAVRARLRPLIEKMTESARRPYTYRGTRQATRGLPIWCRVSERGAVRYEVNRENPLVARARTASAESTSFVDALIRAVEVDLPLETLFADIGESPQLVAQSRMSDEDLMRLLAAYISVLAPDSDCIDANTSRLILSTSPFRDDGRAAEMITKLRRVTD